MMSFDISKIFPKPALLPTKHYNVFAVLSIVCVLVLLFLVVTTPLFFKNGLVTLATLNLIHVVIWLSVWYLIRRGPSTLTIVLMCLSVALFSISATLSLGLESGFQYYLLSLGIVLLLYPAIKSTNLLFLSGSLVVIFLILYIYLTKYPVGHTRDELLPYYVGNLAFAAFVVLVINLYFRTNVEGLIRRLNHSANTDKLTGLLNRRSMQVELERHCNLIKRYKQTNALILIDIDNFKQINDRYGHNGGDEILIQFAGILQDRLRDSDFVARWGGEEFLVLLPFTGQTNAAIVAEELRKIIEQHNFTADKTDIKVTMTCGVGELRPVQPVSEALSHVDQLLYEGKENGRNQVVVETNMPNEQTGTYARAKELGHNDTQTDIQFRDINEEIQSDLDNIDLTPNDDNIDTDPFNI